MRNKTIDAKTCNKHAQKMPCIVKFLIGMNYSKKEWETSIQIPQSQKHIS